MQQQINLYRYLAKTDRFRFTYEITITLYTFFLLLILLQGIFELWKYYELKSELASAEKSLKQTQEQFHFVLKKYPFLDEKDLEKTLQHLQMELVSRTAMYDRLAQNVQFSAYLTGFAKAIVPGVWLTDIELNVHSPYINLRGHALQTAQVQQFIDQLMRQTVFANMAFSLQELSQTELKGNTIINFSIMATTKDRYV